jgi:pyruvate,water dikinase
MGEYTVKLDDAKSGAERIGAKAGRLGELLSAGLPVPQGFVLTTDAYIKFLRQNKIANKISGLLEESHSAGMERLREISSQIRGLIENGVMPDFLERELKEEYQDLSIGREAKEIGGAALDLIKAGRDNVFVAVRPSPSSAGMPSANFSGQMKTILSLRGHQQISDAVRECWASLFSLRAMLYRKRKRVREMPAMGVIIQKSMEPEKSGFAWTSQPETGDDSRIVIEGSWGFGESIISGMVTPDEYVISKETGNLEERKIRKKLWLMKRDELTGKIVKETVFRERVEAGVFEQKELKRLCELAMKAERQFGHPQEIEWCEERGRLFILDSGPVPDYGISPGNGEGLPETGKPLVQGICAYGGLAKGHARIFTSMSDMERVRKGDILVTRMATPEMLPLMDRVSGMVTDEGSRSCHASVLAREFGVPCIVCAGNATSVLRDEQDIVFNAAEGVFSIPEQPAPEPVSSELKPPGEMPYAGPPFPPVPAQPYMESPGDLRDNGITATGVKAIVSIPGKMGQAAELSDGAGLVRAEHIITETGRHPFYIVRHSPEEIISSLLSSLGGIAKAFYPKPVWYRSIDIRTDEFRELEGGVHEPSENNPIMGWHGIRRSLDQPELLKIEIEVIRKLYQEGLNNIVLGLPFISGVEELKAVKQLANFPLRIGIMVETPAAGLEMENFCKEGIAFAAIGLNDLTQLTLGVDRDNSRISKLYSELNPAVINLLKHILRTCRKYGVETSVYGDFVSDPRIAESLVGLGVGSISAEPEGLEEVRRTISRTERKLILDNLRNRPGVS